MLAGDHAAVSPPDYLGRLEDPALIALRESQRGQGERRRGGKDGRRPAYPYYPAQAART